MYRCFSRKIIECGLYFALGEILFTYGTLIMRVYACYKLISRMLFCNCGNQITVVVRRKLAVLLTAYSTRCLYGTGSCAALVLTYRSTAYVTYVILCINVRTELVNGYIAHFNIFTIIY